MLRLNNRHRGWWQNLAFFLTTLLVVTADQLAKHWIRSNLESLPASGFFRLTYVHNTGAAFGLFQDQSSLLITIDFIGVAILLALALFIYRRIPLLDSMPGKITLGLICGGTVGNLIDRLTTDLHYVTDFISIGIWPAFNIADSAVVVGFVILAYWLISSAQSRKR